jgi:hypothetical protein
VRNKSKFIFPTPGKCLTDLGCRQCEATEIHGKHRHDLELFDKCRFFATVAIMAMMFSGVSFEFHLDRPNTVRKPEE